MHKEIAVKLSDISKEYKLYNKPIDRLKESLNPLKKQYHKKFHALKNVDLEIKKGEVLGIVGVNGAGKSTLLKIIAGVLTPTTGRVAVHGKVNAILELGSGLKPEMTGRENIRLNLQINGLKADDERVMNDIVAFAAIGEFIDQPVKTYSSGMKARLGFAIATSTDPDVLIVDEVLAVGDVLFQRKCYGRIDKLFKDGKTVIFVSHSTQSVIEFCTRAVLLYERSIIMSDTPKKVTDVYQKLLFSKDHRRVLRELQPDRSGSVQQTEISKELGRLKRDFSKSSDDYNEGLKTEPKVVNNAGVQLETMVILDEKDQIVNQLATGRTYKLYLKLQQDVAYDDWTFGIAISNVKGTFLSCTREFVSEKMGLGQPVTEFYWHFKCNLLTGKYFIKIDFRRGRELLLYESTDALLIEVDGSKVERKYQMKSCMVDLNQNIEVIS